MTNPADTAKVVENLNAGWRNYICDAMKLDRNTFQLAQGTLGLQTTDSAGLFQMADAVPPSNTVAIYDSSTMNKRSSNYLGLLSALLPETSPIALQQALGDMYSSWITYKTTATNWGTGATLLSVYTDWSNKSSIDPGRATRGQAAIAAAQNSPLLKAFAAYNLAANQQTFTRSDGTSFTLPVYTANIQNAQAAINTPGSAQIDFDSNTMDTSHSGLFVEASVEASYWIFSASADASFNQQNSKAAGSGITIKGNINYATLSSGPGAWYDSNEANRAMNGKGDAQIWDPQASAGNWDSFFGQPNGSLSRYVSQLVLVTDYSLTTTSKAVYSQDDLKEIETKASFGVWPFFSASGGSTQKNTYNLNSDSNLEVTQTLGHGLIQIWGVTVQNTVAS